MQHKSGMFFFTVIFSVTLVLFSQALAQQPKSAIQFYDTTTTNKTATIGWTGDQSTGHFFVTTPQGGSSVELIKGQAGEVGVTGNVTATGTVAAAGFSGSGATLTGIPQSGVAGLTDSIKKKVDSTWVVGKIAAGSGGVTAAAVSDSIKRKADTSWVNTRIAGKASLSGASFLGNVRIGEQPTPPSYLLSINSYFSAAPSPNEDDFGIYHGSNPRFLFYMRNYGQFFDMYNGTGNIANSIKSDGDSYFNGGKVGIGTTTPSNKLELNAASGGSMDGLTECASIKRSSTATNQQLQMGWLNDTTASILARSSTGTNTNLSFGTGSTERVRILSNGNVGIGTTTIPYKLTVQGEEDLSSGEHFLALFRSSTGTAALNFGYRANGTSITGNLIRSTNNLPLYFGTTRTNQALSILDNGYVGIGTNDPGDYKLKVCGDIATTGTAVALNVACTSDRRFKQSITPLDSSLEKVTHLQGVSYDWNRTEFPARNFPEGQQIGLIAQDVEKVIPDVVHTDSDGYKSLSYDKLTAVLIEAVKELKAHNNIQDSIIKAQSSKIELLERLLGQ